MGERFSSPSGSGRSPTAKRYLVNLRLKTSPLVETIIFPWNRKINFVPPLSSLFLSTQGFLWRILRRRGCLWTPLIVAAADNNDDDDDDYNHDYSVLGRQLTTFNRPSRVDIGAKRDSMDHIVRPFHGKITGQCLPAAACLEADISGASEITKSLPCFLQARMV